MKRPSIKILICCHKQYPVLRTKILTPIHVGRACASEDVKNSLEGMIGDDTGTNISNRNPYFCELTAIYWAWKNLERLGNPTHIGLFHYRRFINFRSRVYQTNHIPQTKSPIILNRVLGWSDGITRQVCQDSDIILPTRGVSYTELLAENGETVREPITIYEQYAQAHHRKDLDIVLELVAQRFPRYKETANRVIYSHTESYPCNMFIMRRDVFDRYAGFIFDILFEAEKIIDVTNYDQYNSRVFGFLGERLMPVFIEQLRSEKAAVRIEERPIVFLEAVTLNYHIKTVLAPHIPRPILSARRKLWKIVTDLVSTKSYSKI